jgi:hypothetical protein
VDYARLSQQAQAGLEALPKFALRQPVPAALKRRVLTRWLAEKKAAHRSAMHRCVL